MSSLNQSTLARVAVRGTTWVYIAFFSGKFIVFLTTIFLARLLSKSDFGVVGYAVTIIGFLDVMKDLGPEFFIPLDGHMNALGHRRVAERLAAVIQQ